METVERWETLDHILRAAALDPIIVMDPEGRIAFWNDAATRVFGYGREEAVGRPLHELIIPPRLRAAHLRGFRNFQATGAGALIGRTIELAALRKNKSEFPVELSISSIKLEDQWFAVGIVRDVTARKRLEDSWKTYEFIVNTSNDGMSLIDRNYVYQVVNDAYCLACDLTRSEIIGKTVSDIWGRDVFEGSIKPQLDRCFEGNEVHYQAEFKFPAMGPRVYLVRAYPYVDVENRVSSVVVVTRDITARRLAEETQARLAAIVESSQDAIISVNLDGAILTWNESAARMYGYSAQEAVGKHASIIFPPDRMEELPRLLEQLKQGVRLSQYETVRCRKDGTLIHVALSLAPLTDTTGRVTGVSSVARDITDRKRAEEQIAAAHRKLSASHTVLEEMIQERTADLTKANRDLETLLYVVSHDLKEPLRGITNFSSLLEERYGERLDEKGRDFLGRVLRAGRRMGMLLDDILQLSRLERMRAPVTEIDAGLAVAEALVRLEDTIRKTRAQIKVKQDMPRIKADTTWAVEAIYNLVTNAMKFTLPEHAPDVEIGGYQPQEGEPDETGLVVRDRGPGVPASQREKIFELFKRGVKREVEGTGAGLAIVRRIAERHGGHAWVRAREGGGSEFVITFGKS